MGALMVYDLRWDLDDFKLDLHIGVTAIDDIVISGINTTSVKSPQTASAYCFGFIASDVWEVKAERIHRNIILNIIIQRVEVRRHVFQIFTSLCFRSVDQTCLSRRQEKNPFIMFPCVVNTVFLMVAFGSYQNSCLTITYTRS